MTATLVLSCLKIFFGRVLDVSAGTLRMVLTVKEKPVQAALCGFAEAMLWFLIVNSALKMDAPLPLVVTFYSGGFAAGTYIGGKLSENLISGHLFINIITSSRDDSMLTALRSAGFAITVIDANKSEYGSEKYLIIADIDKRDFKRFKGLVKSLDENAFIVVKDTKSHIGGYISSNR